MNTKETNKKIYCNTCENQTIHLLVSTYSNIDSDNSDVVWWINEWNVWECGGCKTLTGEVIYKFSETVPDFDRTFYPKREDRGLNPKIYEFIPEKLDELYKEVIISCNNSCNVLCAMGLRALIEGILVDKGIKGGTLYDKIENADIINESIRTNLHGFRFLGNDAAHELEKPSREDLWLAIDVIEDILNISYELDTKSKLIHKKFSKGR